MGNILITILSAFIPITLHTSIIPTLLRPDILGGSPWSPPSMLTYLILYYSMMYIILWAMSFIANLYTTLFNCDKTDVARSAGYANYTPVIAILGVFLNNTLLLPFVKSMILSAVNTIPYALHFVNGGLMMPFVFIGTMFSQRLLNYVVCGSY
jgi:hypothetical protein